jgi:hypothetical protein
MYAREVATPDKETAVYDEVDEKTVEWLKAQVDKRKKARSSDQLHPELIGRS